MEEKYKYKNYLLQKNKIEDIYQAEKSKTLIKTNSSLLLNSLNSLNKIDYIYKNKDLNKFKDEILSYISERDNYYSEKIKNLQSQCDNNNKNIDKLSDNVKENICNITTKQVEINTKLEKINLYEAFMNKANDKLISHEIRINNIKEDLIKSNQKYDKIYLENLEIPGYIGKSSKYPNCKIFFTEIIKEMEKFNNFREKNIIDLFTYKEKLEGIIKTFQTIVENNNNSQIKYITKLNDKTNKNILDIMEEKIKNVRIDNSQYSIDLIKKAKDLNTLYDKINSIKEYMLEEFNIISNEYNNKIDETNKLFNEFKIEYEIIRSKFLELADFIKNGKFTRNFISTIGRKDINSISKKLNKDNKNNIDPKDVKLMNNIQEIEKMDFNAKNTIDFNSNYNINNKFQKKIKFSKSQNNFNNKKNKSIDKLGKFAGNNENKNLLNKEKKGLKINHGALFYNKGKNLTEINSTKNLTNRKIIFKNNNSDIENLLPLNNINTNYEPIKNAKSERKSKERTNNNIIKKIKKDKINSNKINNDELIELKLSKIKKEKESRNNHNINNINEDLSMSESCISNINNSINTFSTTNDKNNSFNSININLNNNNNKIGKFNIFENGKEHNDKIIKELASDLEQSTVKGNELASNKKKIEENFKSICNKIQPVNLKLNNNNLEKIEEYVEKNNNITNKSEQNTTIFSHNINNNNIEISSNSNSNNILGRNNKLKELIELTEKLEENSIKSNKSNYSIKNKENNTNFNIDKRMNAYDKKLGDLELFMREQILEIIKQITLIKNNYMFISNILKKENNTLNPLKIKEYNTITNSHSKVNIFNKCNTNSNKNGVNNENKNNLNYTTNYFYKKTPTIEINSKLSNSKKEQNHEDINLSDNLFYNGNYYFNIKDILGKKKDKNNINYFFDNKNLLKSIDGKVSNEKTNNKNNI